MAYPMPSNVDSRPITIDGAGTMGLRIASVYAAAGTEAEEAGRTGEIDVPPIR